MEGPVQVDTSSGRFQGQWSFINPSGQYGNSMSLPPSSGYLRSDRSSISPQVGASPFLHLNNSGSSLSRVNAASIGGTNYSTVTAPSQPVLSRIHSNVASHYLNPIARPPRRRTIMNKDDELPPLSAYSFEGILSAIQEDIEEDLNGIADILGRSRLVLADQHDSHLPPTGEIRAMPLQSVAETSSSNERLADDVVILHENASLVDGSQNGSHAYGLLERLQAMPRTGRLYSDLVFSAPQRRELPPAEVRNSSPAVLTAHSPSLALDVPEVEQSTQMPTFRTSLDLLQSRRFSAETLPHNTAVVSEVWLSAGANGIVISDPPVVSEAGRHYPLYSFDESEVFDANVSPDTRNEPQPTLRQRIQNALLLKDLQRNLLWSIGTSSSGPPPSVRQSSGAEVKLRDILGRQVAAVRGGRPSADDRAPAGHEGAAAL